MAKAVPMLPPSFPEVAREMQLGDEVLIAQELQLISVFDELKKAPSFEKFPGFTVLRRCWPGRVICEQGDAGATAFLVLSSHDMLAIRKQQLDSLRALGEREATAEDVQTPHLYFSRLDAVERQAREAELLAEIEELETSCREMDEAVDEESRTDLQQVASAQLVVSLDATRRRRGLKGWLNGLFRKSPGGGDSSTPRLIPIDGPTDIDTASRQAPLFEGELFGEMSCMNRAPRSANVVATRECYLLEIMRNVLDTLHNDPQYKERMDAVYRDRVLEAHVRQLSLFGKLTDEEFASLQEHIELVTFESGQVICEEHEASDCFYLIRSGVVKITANSWCRLRAEEFSDADWKPVVSQLWEKCRAGEDLASGLVADALSDEFRERLRQADENGEITGEFRVALLETFNEFICAEGVPKALGKTRSQLLENVGDDVLRVAVEEFSDSCANWSELETRTCRRLLLEQVLRGSLPRRVASAGPRRTQAYLGRGDSLGEIGVVLEEPRSATCTAFDHPDSGFHQRIPDSRTGAVPSRVELVRIPGAVFQDLMASSKALSDAVHKIITKRQQASQDQERRAALDLSLIERGQPQFEQLGLIQGQRLMLIDLDRCTRCGSCVEACIAAHDDGNTRLYLDGPRYGSYLVPLTCRNCLDPVCMIGCPVGAINRGESGEIAIRNWCIGCRMCADQCPYGSIQMNHLPVPAAPDEQQLRLLPPGSDVKKVTDRAVVCDMCESVPGGSPSCVYSCPHDAAMRVDAREFFSDAGEVPAEIEEPVS